MLQVNTVSLNLLMGELYQYRDPFHSGTLYDSPNPQDKVMGHSQYNAVHKYLMKIILVVLIKSQSIHISILYKFI